MKLKQIEMEVWKANEFAVALLRGPAGPAAALRRKTWPRAFSIGGQPARGCRKAGV